MFLEPFCMKQLEESHLGDDTSLGVIQEIYHVLYFAAVRHLFLDLVDGIEKTCLPMEYKAISICDMLLHLLRHSSHSQDGGIDTIIAHGVVASYDIWRNIL